MKERKICKQAFWSFQHKQNTHFTIRIDTTWTRKQLIVKKKRKKSFVRRHVGLCHNHFPISNAVPSSQQRDTTTGLAMHSNPDYKP